MKKIKLKGGKFALVSNEDYELLNSFEWYLLNPDKNFYAVRQDEKNPKTGKRKMIFMHQMILKVPKGLYTDHINGNGLDNRRENLRTCTPTQNNQNRKKGSHNTSGYKGVYLDKRSKKWNAKITVKGKIFNLGVFPSPKLAHKAYCAAAKKYFGEFANNG